MEETYSELELGQAFSLGRRKAYKDVLLAITFAMVLVYIGKKTVK